ncbi:MAG: long-chain fatty acid--CoA ligase [Acidobacteria bacterium]|nr:long-chain fatty acid--CoA ligase [Acidobacteriota bacterium]
MSEPTTLLDFFAVWRNFTPAPALVDARGGADVRVEAPEVARRVAGLAQGLAALGVAKGDRVALLSWNRPEWHIADMAVLHLGAVDVPLYPTLLAAQVGHILKDSGAKVVIVDSDEQLAKVQEVKKDCPGLQHVIKIDGEPPAGVKSFGKTVVELNQAQAEEYLESRRPLVAASDLATLIYTSGTTGDPKGAMLTHDNFVFDAMSSSSTYSWTVKGEVALSFLPLSHVLERLVDYIYFYRGVSIAYCGVLEIAESFKRVRPNLFTAVPRVYEKIHDKIFHEVGHGPAIKQKIFRAAAAAASESSRTGRKGLLHPVFDKLVYAKLREVFGGRLRFSISGGAPLPVFVAEFFQGVGVMVMEGYGLTETSPVITVNTFQRRGIGTVGPVIPGVEVKIAADGEILTRGRHVMTGYWGKPDETAAAIDKDRWFSTGDIGELTADGLLRITDRKKDLLVTAGGKNVAPQPVENALKVSPLVENAVLFGDRQPYIVALLVPNFEALEAWAAAQGVKAENREHLLRHPQVIAAFHKVIDDTNAGLARFEAVKKFRLLGQSFTLEGGELTPTLKVKRRVVEKRHAALLKEMYSEPAPKGE